MDRRDFVGGVATTTMVGQVSGAESAASRPQPAGVTSGPQQAGVGPEWVGARALAGGKGYASGALGQIHYRMVGEGAGVPFLLVHQTPLGIAEYVDVQPALALAGRRSLASDNPGYGFSDPVTRPISVADLADNLRSLCDHAATGRVIVVGHHTGAAIAAAFAARHPSRTAGLILHGTPVYDADERAVRLARPPANLALRAYGGHFADVFLGIGKWAGIDSQTLSSITWATLATFLAGSTSPVYRAVFSNDMAPDLAAIGSPTLILTDRDDPLHANDLRVQRLRPDFALQQFSTGGSFALMREPRRWAQVLVDFARAHGL